VLLGGNLKDAVTTMTAEPSLRYEIIEVTHI